MTVAEAIAMPADASAGATSPRGAEVPITLAGDYYMEGGIPCRWRGPIIDVPMGFTISAPLRDRSPEHHPGLGDPGDVAGDDQLVSAPETVTW